MPNFHLKNSENKAGKSPIFSPYFFALTAIFSVTFCLLFLGSFRAFRSEISVLVIPKNESASFQADQILGNLMSITRRLSFYDRMLSDNSGIKDPFAGLSKDERKARWNEIFSIERLPDSTTLNIAVSGRDKEESEKIARQMALTLSQVASRFYNIRTELEFRIIEGPISSPFVQAWGWLAAGSVLFGMALSHLLLLALNRFSKKIERKVIRKISGKDYFSPSVGGLGISFKKDAFFQTRSRKASAPSNLPIADEKNEEPVEIFASLTEEVPAEKEEPTDDEYRERLNKLLRGEI